MKKEQLRSLEQQCRSNDFDLFYGDATAISERGYVPYGWQFKGEDVCIEVGRGNKVTVFGFYNANNEFHYWTQKENLDGIRMQEIFEEFILRIKRPTVIVLDNASIHKTKAIKRVMADWQKQGLYLFFLPPYSPHLNPIERLWKEIKEGWILPEDYRTKEHLFYAVDRICNAVGKEIKLDMSI